MPVFDTAEVKRLLEATFGVTDYVVTVAAPKIRLATTAPNDTTPGTEVTGGSYSAQAATFGAVTGGSRSISNSTAASYTNMPTATTTHVDIYDNANTTRKAYGQLTTPRATVLGDTLTFAIGAIVCAYS